MVIRNWYKMVLGLTVLILTVQPSLAQMEPGATKAPDQKTMDAANKIQQALDPVLTAANESKWPGQAELAANQRILDESKRYFSQMDEKQKSQFCLMQAWISYYQSDFTTAFKNASIACKSDATSGDAWITQVAMSILADRKPMLPKQPRPQRARTNPNNPDPMGMGTGMEMTDPSQQMMQQGKLSFDLNALLIDAIGQKVEGLNLTCLNGTTFKYEPGQEALCAIIWQEHEIKTVSNEPNIPGRKKPQPSQPQPGMDPMMMESPMGGGFGMDMYGGGFGQDPFSAANMAYSKLFQMGLASGQVKFAAINLDAAEHKQKLIDDVVKRPWPWAVVMAADQQQKMPIALGPLQMRRPVLIMTDKEGTIRYAGPATGIIAPMLMGKVASNGFSTFTVIEGQPELPAIAADPNLLKKPTLTDSNSLPKATPAVPPKPTVAPATPVATGQQTQAQYKELSETEDIEAERQLSVTRDLFMKAGQRRVTSYKNGVESCRTIMKKYPGTKYADEARQLLRQVPENQRSRYNITDEELGL